MIRRSLALLVTLALAGAALAYLRDPPWLLATASGLRGWGTDRDGTRYRWTGGHASFFVPAIDDRPADRVVLADDSWRRLVVRLPPQGTRRVRRIDILLDRTRDGNRGVQLGEIGHR
jgi:hypothetical protein